MSAAQEEEIERLYNCLHSVMAERDHAKQLADQLQVSLFESRLKARQCIEACKRDAIEVATQEAVREHIENTNAMDEIMRRQVSAASADRAMINAIRSALYEMHGLSESFMNVTLSSISTLPQTKGEEPQEERSNVDIVDVNQIRQRLYGIMHSSEMMFFLEEGGSNDKVVTEDEEQQLLSPTLQQSKLKDESDEKLNHTINNDDTHIGYDHVVVEAESQHQIDQVVSPSLANLSIRNQIDIVNPEASQGQLE